jgi:hypothetical protein
LGPGFLPGSFFWIFLGCGGGAFLQGVFEEMWRFRDGFLWSSCGDLLVSCGVLDGGFSRLNYAAVLNFIF